MNRYFLYFDLSQAEPRMLAAMTGDPMLAEAMAPGKDMYKEVFAMVAGMDPADVTKEQRKIAKVMFLAAIYSLGNPHFIATAVKVSREEATKLMDDFKKTFHVAWSAIEEQIEIVRETGKQTCYSGRVVQYFEHKSWNKEVQRKLGMRVANNWCQNSVSILLKEIIRDVSRKCKSTEEYSDVQVAVPVFDALLLSVPESVEPAKLKEFLLPVVDREIEGIQIGSEWAHGKTWGKKDMIPLD
jgi:DNA polymerase-1